MFGGKCTGLRWVRVLWAREPHNDHCTDCQCYVQYECEVANGLEAPKHAECLMDHVRNEEIRTPWNAKRRQRNAVYR
jgi:hypothetical protein